MYKKNSRGIWKHLDFAVLDFLCMVISYFTACKLYLDEFPFSDFILEKTFLFYLIVNILVTVFSESFKNVLHRGYAKEFRYSAVQVILVTMAATGLLFFTKTADLQSRVVVMSTAALYLPITYVVRIGYKRFLQRVFQKNTRDSMLIITTSDRLAEVSENLEKNVYNTYFIHGVIVLDRDLEGQEIYGTPVVANADNLLDYVCRNWVDEIFFNVTDPESWKADALTAAFLEMGITVHERLYIHFGSDGWQHTVEHLGHYTVLTSSLQAITMRQALCKRTLDILGSLVGMAFTALLTVVIGPIIYFQSPGPIFFQQERVGKNGRTFKMYKFRSMYLDAEERKLELAGQNRVADGMMFKLDWDPRIIGNKELPDGTRKSGIGEFIRKTSLDEFPQFWNVLKGDMSLVGTRPPTLDEWEKYESHHRARMAAKPGITGMWQISGRSEITDFEEVVRLDREYISNWTLGLDFKILLKTLTVVLERRGSM